MGEETYKMQNEMELQNGGSFEKRKTIITS
jgi:hypothetical protein